MKRILYAAIALFITLGGISCEKMGKNDNSYKRLELSTKATEYVNQGNDFAFKFIDKVNDAETGDFFISPLSMQFLLSMLLDGAEGQTADEICSVLGYGAGERDAVNDFCRSMLKQLPEMDRQTSLEIANAIVVNKNYPLLPGYTSAVRKYFEAEVSNLDFSDVSGTVNKINKWCAKHTNGLIPKIINEVSPDAIVYLMNALYFKSQWKDKFSKSITALETFTKEDGSKGKVQMMKASRKYSCQGNDVFSAVRLPYGNEVFSMVVILPNKGKTVDDVTDYLTADTWNEFVRTMVSCEVDLWMPKFETSYKIQLNNILADMGMPSAFNAMSANFKAMSNVDLYLSLVKQNAVIKVDEEGTEAAAVSFSGMEMESVGPGDFVVFHADRPFLYLITEASTGAILFAGKYSGK